MPRPSISAELRRRVRRRARHRCHYPQVACYAAFHVDHFTPQSQGGPTAFDNLVFACPTCNASKHAKVRAYDRVTGETLPLFNPRKDIWHDHFAWSRDGRTLIARTPTGRVTIRALRMNRRGVTVLRSMLIDLGLHPAD